MPDSDAMSTRELPNNEPLGPWNPGIRSQVPHDLLPLVTLFRAENSFSSVAKALELHDLTGLDLEELATLRPERLVLHELLIRITADMSVPDGTQVEDLGINFRAMTRTMLERYIAPHLPEIIAAYAQFRQAAQARIAQELATTLFPSATVDTTDATSTQARAGWLRKLGFGSGSQTRSAAPESLESREQRALQSWAHDVADADALHASVCRALHKVVSALCVRHGHVWGDASLIAAIATDLVCNDEGSVVIGRAIEPYIEQAIAAEGYMRLPAQGTPVVMNVKGASASGKSTMRPLQKALAKRIGVDWREFALVSPDIWRKYLLDYASLGAAFRYAGSFTGHEIKIIDQKLDRYMAAKAARGRMSHLLIDRFRFDSFAADSSEQGSNLLTRFGAVIYLFFMITPPESTVERAWARGLQVGRYKPVDDLLAHNVEAFTGMPQLFFTWALRNDKVVHYEFLDNSVAAGERPRTAAFGVNGEMTVLDVKCMLDIDRYRKINVDAKCPREVYPSTENMRAQHNTTFLAQCARSLSALRFADQATGYVYLRLEHGRVVFTDERLLARAAMHEDTRAGLEAIGIAVHEPGAGASARASEAPLRPEDTHTLGQWGGGAIVSEAA